MMQSWRRRTNTQLAQAVAAYAWEGLLAVWTEQEEVLR